MKFGTIIVDPPWPYARVSSHKKLQGYVSKNGNEKYKTLSIADLKNLPVSEVAAEQSVVLIWTTPAMSAEGAEREICIAWGFRPVTYTYWLKKTKNGKLHYGVGYWFRGCIEPILVGVRGHSYRGTVDRGLIEAPVQGHSRKPDDLLVLAERRFPEPRLELFARRNYPNWTGVGYELTGRDITEDLDLLKNLEQ